MPSKKKKYNARFPPARIKKIMQTDEEVGKVAAAVPVIISRALELFVESLLRKTSDITQKRNAKTLTTYHLKQCILAEPQFDFLKDLVASVADVHGDEETAETVPSPAATRGRQSGTTRGRRGRKPRHRTNSPGPSHPEGSSSSEGEEEEDGEDEEEDGSESDGQRHHHVHNEDRGPVVSGVSRINDEISTPVTMSTSAGPVVSNRPPVIQHTASYVPPHLPAPHQIPPPRLPHIIAPPVPPSAGVTVWGTAPSSSTAIDDDYDS